MSEFIGTKLTMNLGERSYDIIVKSGSLENLYQFARLDRRVAVVTDSGVPAQYAQMVADQCKDATIITVPQGEASKSIKVYTTVLQAMLEFGMTRADLVVADTVYNPRETRMIREARATGCQAAVGGIGMLLWQGVAAFKLYTGKDMPVEEVKERFFS